MANKIKLKVGPKGQIVIPESLRKTYNIKEGETLIAEPRDDGILIKKAVDIDDLLKWISERRKKIKGITGRLGDLAEIDLEGEFDE
ncbi:MAG: AbrB/MazE/SpoVT family DNA-binding domain-containing protein [Candidatus Asgardarchaeia archaeon]